MQLKLIRHLWGVDQGWETAFGRIRAEGFVGVEGPLVAPEDVERFSVLRKTHALEYVAMAFTGGDSVAAHVRSFEQQVHRAVELGASQLTCQGGSDTWNPGDAESFYREALAIEASVKLPVAHETHRGRVFFNPWITRSLLEKFPPLRLCCDFSHWVCVAERLGWDDPAGTILKICASRCIHIHARVGYPEGPQVPDPSAPEYANELAEHERWWEVIWSAQRDRGCRFSTFTPEFGPPGYLHTLPHTNVPVADLWTICKWMADRLARRFTQ